MTTDESLNYWKSETVAFLALQSIKGVGFKCLYNLAKKNISFRDVIKPESAEYFQKILRITLPDDVTDNEESWNDYQQSLWNTGLSTARSLKSQNIRVVFYSQDHFPNQLKKLSTPPLWLFVQGNFDNLHKNSLAIVGSRSSTDDGLWLTKYIVSALANSGLATVSGLADGIDQKAHLESIKFNVPTIAVLGTGIDSNYPAGSDVVRQTILDHGGTIVSEYLLKQSYSAANFIRRNRIQAGLSSVVIPVEWKVKSGTAHTVSFAKEFNRLLFMPYLPNHDFNSAELNSVGSYKRGCIFLVPNLANVFLGLIESLSSNTYEQDNDVSNDVIEQSSLNL